MEAGCTMQFTYTPNYPDELPIVELLEPENLENQHIDKLMSCVKEQVHINITMKTQFNDNHIYKVTIYFVTKIIFEIAEMY